MEIKLKVQGYFVYLKKKIHRTFWCLLFNIAFEFDTTMSFVDMFQR